MTKKQALELLESDIKILIEEEIDNEQSDFSKGWNVGFNFACELIISTIKELK